MACEGEDGELPASVIGRDSIRLGADTGSIDSVETIPFWHDKHAPGWGGWPACCATSVQPSGQSSGSAATRHVKTASRQIAKSFRTWPVYPRNFAVHPVPRRR